jgi:hypothetical protein
VTRPALSAPEFDSFSVAAGSSLITGALSVVAPFLTALSVTLVVLAMAGWVATLRKQRSGGRSIVPSRRWAALATLAAGAVLFLIPAPVPEAFHGLVLPLSLVPLWLVERERPGGFALLRGIR